jgi:hypothetical protein
MHLVEVDKCIKYGVHRIRWCGDLMSLVIFGFNFVGFDAQSLLEWRERLMWCAWLDRGGSVGVGVALVRATAVGIGAIGVRSHGSQQSRGSERVMESRRSQDEVKES